MKIIILVFVFMFATLSFAEDIYTYKDEHGATVISNTPIPEKYQKKAKRIEGYTPLTDRERDALSIKGENDRRQKKAEDIELSRKKAETEYYKQQKDLEEKRIAEEKRRKEEAKEAAEKAREAANARRFFNSKLGTYSPY